MGSCFSSEGGRREGRKKSTETSRVPPTEPAATGMAGSDVTVGAPRVESASNHGMELMEGSEVAARVVFSTKHGLDRHLDSVEFTYQELYWATGGFRADRVLGEGGFGQVYKGFLGSINQEVAIKKLDLQGQQGNREFHTEVMMLSKLHHPNLVKLFGYCIDDVQRLLVYEYMPLGSLMSHIHDLPPDQEPLDWITRIKILIGAANGLQHLHDNVVPPVINRDVKCANILLGEGYHPKLSDFGLAKLGPTGDATHVSTRIMGTAGYCAPEYLMSGQLTIKSDVYSFGVVMLEVLTGRKAKDDSLAPPEQILARWAVRLIKEKDLVKLADPALQGQYPSGSLYLALLVAGLCVNETPSSRPTMADVAATLEKVLEVDLRSRRRSANR